MAEQSPAEMVEHYLRKIISLSGDAAVHDKNKADQINRLATKSLALLPSLSSPSPIIPASDEL